MKYMYIVSFNRVILECFSRRMSCRNWLCDNLPKVCLSDLVSYPQFCRKMLSNKPYELRIGNHSSYEVARYPLISRYVQGQDG